MLKAEMTRDGNTAAWRELMKLKPGAFSTAVKQLESRMAGLVSREPEWYSKDAQLMLALSKAVEAKTAASSWPEGLAMLQERQGASSLEELLEAEALAVEAHRGGENFSDAQRGRETSIGPECAYGACALFMLGSNLQELNLQGHQLGEAGAEALGNVLPSNKSLRILNLAGSQLASNVTTAGAIHIFVALETNSTLTKLSLADNRLDGQDITFQAALHRALQKNCSLVEVDLRYNRSLGLAGADAVLDAKAPLRRLNVLNTCVGVNKARQLAMLDVDTLCGLNGDETKFLAPHMALDSGDAVLLATELRRNGSGLTNIDLSHNQLKDNALETITKAMQGSKNLRSLAVAGNSFTEAASQTLKDVARLKKISLDILRGEASVEDPVT